MIGRTPGNIVAIRPLKDGVIADFDTTERMLRYFIQKVHKRRHLAKPRIVVCVPERHHRGRAARGQGRRLRGRRAQGLHHRGADGRRDRRRAPGARADRQHGRRHRRRHHRGRRHLARRHRHQPVDPDRRRRARQRDHPVRQEGVLADARRAHRRGDQDGDRLGVPDRPTSRTPRSAAATWSPGCRRRSSCRAEEIRKAIEEPVNAIVDAVKTTLDKCPPELSGDIMDRGIVLTGGGALLKGLDERLRHETGMPIHIADDPLDSVAHGLRQVRRGVRGAAAGADLRAASLTSLARRGALPGWMNGDTRRHAGAARAALLVTSISLITIDYRGGDELAAGRRPRRSPRPCSARSSGRPRPSPARSATRSTASAGSATASDEADELARGERRSSRGSCAPASSTAAGPQELDDLLQLAGAGRYAIVPGAGDRDRLGADVLLDRHPRRRQPRTASGRT